MTIFNYGIAMSLLAGFILNNSLHADEPTFRDVLYGTVGEVSLKLDFFEPTQRRQERPLIIWIHGGAWRSGSKSDVPIIKFREQGFAVASVDYRLSPVARFPSQIHDIKTAIRYLRLHAERLEVDVDRFVLAGASAGGHLAVLAAVSDGVQELSGPNGASEIPSLKVKAVVSFYGASNLQTILAQSTPFGINMRVPALELLLGGVPEQEPALARLASPVEHIDPSDPPLWLFHGDQDPQMPINQAHELVGSYKKVGLPVQLDVIYGGKHGGSEFYTDDRLGRLSEELWSLMSAVRPPSPSNPTKNVPMSDSSEQLEGKKAKTYQLSGTDFNSLPDIEVFRSRPSDQFIVPWEAYRTGHPYLGTSAA